MSRQALVHRAVEILHQVHGHWTVGSGCLTGGRLVLTAAHNVVEAGETGTLLVRGRFGGPVREYPAEIHAVDGSPLLGDPHGVADLAVLRVTAAEFDDTCPPVPLATVDRGEPTPLEGCWAVGFPRFEERATGRERVRDTAHLWGRVLPAAHSVRGTLAFQVSSPPAPLPPGDLADSPWQGISGAVVFAPDASNQYHVVGVVTEHHRPEGEAALTVAPVTAARHPDGSDARRRLLALGAEPPAPLPALSSGPVVRRLTERAEPGQVADFMRRLARNGLAAHFRFRPDHLRSGELADHCSTPRVIDEDRWLQALRRRAENRTEDPEPEPLYALPTHDVFLREGPTGVRMSAQPLSAVRAGHDRHVLLRGEPGEGKTVALWLEAGRSAAAVAARAGSEDLLRARVPLVLPLGGARTDAGGLLRSAAAETLRIAYGDRPPEAVRHWLDAAVEARRVELYLDALDEFAGAGTEDESRMTWLRRELADLEDLPVMMTSRLSVDALGLLAGPLKLRMACFGLTQVRTFVNRYFDRGPLGRRLAEELYQELRASEALRELGQLPLLLSLICQAKSRYPDAVLPVTTGDLLRTGLQGLLPRDTGAAERVLRHVAWRFWGRGPLRMREEHLTAALLDAAAAVGAPKDPHVLLDGFLRSGVLVRRGPHEYGFVLRSLQEFAVACWIADESPAAADEAAFVTMMSAAGPGWQRPEWPWHPCDEDQWKYLWSLLAERLAERAVWLVRGLRHRDIVDLDDRPQRLRALCGAVRHSVHAPEAARVVADLETLMRDDTYPDKARARAAISMGLAGMERSAGVLAAQARDAGVPEKVRTGAVLGLYHLGGPAGRGELRALLGNTELPRDAQSVVQEGLGKVLSPEEEHELIALLDDGSAPPELRESALRVLGWNVSDPSVTATVRRVALTPDHPLRVTALMVSEDFGNETSKQALLRVLRDDGVDAGLRLLAAISLGRMADTEIHDILLSTVAVRPGTAATEDGGTPPEGAARLGAVIGLGYCGTPAAVRELARCYQDRTDDPNARKGAAFALGLCGGEYAGRALRWGAAAKDEQEEIRTAGVHGLAQIGDDACAAAMNALMLDPEEEDEVRYFAAACAGWLRPEQAVDALREVLLDERAPLKVRRGACGALGTLEDWQTLLVVAFHPDVPAELAEAALAAQDPWFQRLLTSFLKESLASPELRPKVILGGLRIPALHDALLESIAQEVTDPAAPDDLRVDGLLHLAAFGPAATPVLTGVLDDPDSGALLHRAAALSLAQRDDDSSFDALLERVTGPDAEQDVRVEAALALSTSGDPERRRRWREVIPEVLRGDNQIGFLRHLLHVYGHLDAVTVFVREWHESDPDLPALADELRRVTADKRAAPSE